jgi:hypothetical protein
MVNYDELITALEDAWQQVGLHEHALVESVIPATLDRSCKIELFPEHDEPLHSGNLPPWVEISLNWSAVHQLISEGRELEREPLEITWSYYVVPTAAADRSDLELVRMFQRAVQTAYQQHFPAEADTLDPVAVEVRRGYEPAGQRVALESLQLVCNIAVDLFEQLQLTRSDAVDELLLLEMRLAAAIIKNLRDTFAPGGRGGYRSVDAA